MKQASHNCHYFNDVIKKSTKGYSTIELALVLAHNQDLGLAKFYG